MMECKPNRLLFNRFFNVYDTDGQYHSGFFTNFNFSSYYSGLDIISEVVGALLDAYLFNEYSKRYVVSTWAAYMRWDKANKRYIIDPAFYTDFVKAFCGHLMTAENFFQITQFDWDDIKEVIKTTRAYGEHAKTRERGNDTTTTGARRDTQSLDYGQAVTTNRAEYGGTSNTLTDTFGDHVTTDNNAYAKQESDVTTENDKA